MLPPTIATSVWVNGILVTGRQIESWLGKYSVNLFIWNHWDECKVRIVGSASPLHYRGEYFLVCTSHQLRDANLEDVSLITECGVLAVTSSGFAQLNGSSAGQEVDFQDIVAFNFTPACEANPSLKSLFFPFRDVPPDCQSDQIMAVINYGFPSNDQIYELYERNHIGSRRRSTLFKVGKPSLDPTILHLRPTTALKFNPDGLSGGPNFAIQEHNREFRAYFAGVTVRGGQNDLYIVKSGYIRMLLDKAIGEG